MYHRNNRQGERAFALPVVLSAGVLLIAMLSIAIKNATNNNFGSRIRLLSALTNSALESITNEYRALLNDVSNSRFLSYFWLVNGCSTNNSSSPSNCPRISGGAYVAPTGIQNPSLSYWDDAPFCNGASGTCLGRQIAPSCDFINPNSNYVQSIPWNLYKASIDSSFNTLTNLSKSAQTATEYVPYGNINSYSTIGSIELGGRSQLDIAGLIQQRSILKGERRARVSMEIERSLPYKGFAFISAGIKQSDFNSIHLSNLRTINTSGGSAKGVIQLRRNMTQWNNSLNPNNCTRSSDIFFYSRNYSFPTRGNGGLLVHSSHWPTSTKIPSNAPAAPPQNLIVRGNLKESIGSSTKERTLTYRNLFILRGSTYTIETSDQSPVILQLTDSLDVLPGGRLCHVSKNSSVCGSGKAHNLTILSTFKDYNTNSPYYPVSSHTGCSAPRRGEGTGEVYSERDPNTSRAAATFTFSSTGRTSTSEKLSAFIYGKDLAFTSSGLHRGSNGTFLLDTNDSRYNLNSPALVIHRGRRAVTNLTSINDKRVWGLLGPSRSRFLVNGDDSRSWSVNRMRHDDSLLDGHKVVGVSRISIYGQTNSRYFYTPEYIAITYNWRNNSFKIWDAVIRKSTTGPNSSVNSNTDGLIQIVQPSSSSIRTLWGQIPRQFNANDLNSYAFPLKVVYSLAINRPTNYDQNSVRRFAGAVWARQVCFSRNWAHGDYLQNQYWEFDPDFVENIAKRYGTNFKMGYAVYKSRYIKTWDILRDFYN